MKLRAIGISGGGWIGKAAALGLLMLLPACGWQSAGGPSADSSAGAAASPSEPDAPPATSGPDGLIASPEPDWPQWRGPGRDGISAEKGLLPSWPESGPPLVWKITDLGRGWSSPIIVGERLYITGDVGERLVISAFDLDGKPKWRVANGRSWTGPYVGARACCAYSEGKLYHLNAHGRLACLDAATGSELWASDLLPQFQASEPTWGFSECLLVDGRRVIVTPGGDKALMAALDKQSGRTVWTTEPLVGDRASHASPILFRHAGRRVLANCSSAHGFGVDADTGKLLWTVPLRNQYEVNITPPVYHAGKIFFVSAYVYGTCYRLPPGGAGPQPETAWTTTLDSCTGAVLLIDGLLYGSGYQKHKSWLCLDWDSGRVRYEFKGLPTSSAVYAEGRLYCLAEDGRAALAKPAAGQFELTGQFRLVPNKVHDAWAYPVLLHGRLYLRYYDTLWCYDVRGK
jgi:outer membrane protein assembly factor BamB